MKRKKIGLAVALIGVFLVVISRCTIKAEAADNVILSMEQTLALYGTQFNVTYYNPDRDYVVSVPCEYIGNSYQLVPNSHFDDIYFYGKGNINMLSAIHRVYH